MPSCDRKWSRRTANLSRGATELRSPVAPRPEGQKLASNGDERFLLLLGGLFRSFDGPIAEAICEQYTGTRDVCAHASGCSVAPVWAELARRIYGFLDGVTVADIAAGTLQTTPQVVPLAMLRRR